MPIRLPSLFLKHAGLTSPSLVPKTCEAHHFQPIIPNPSLDMIKNSEKDNFSGSKSCGFWTLVGHQKPDANWSNRCFLFICFYAIHCHTLPSSWVSNLWHDPSQNPMESCSATMLNGCLELKGAMNGGDLPWAHRCPKVFPWTNSGNIFQKGPKTLLPRAACVHCTCHVPGSWQARKRRIARSMLLLLLELANLGSMIDP